MRDLATLADREGTSPAALSKVQKNGNFSDTHELFWTKEVLECALLALARCNSCLQVPMAA